MARNQKENSQRWSKKHSARIKKCRRNSRTAHQILWRNWFLIKGYIPPSPEFHYHHADPEIKEFSIGRFFLDHSCSTKWQFIMEQELEKCILLSRKEHAKLHRALKWRKKNKNRRIK